MKSNVIEKLFKRNYNKKNIPSYIAAAIRRVFELRKNKSEEEEIFHRLCEDDVVLFDEYSNDMEGY